MRVDHADDADDPEFDHTVVSAGQSTTQPVTSRALLALLYLVVL